MIDQGGSEVHVWTAGAPAGAALADAWKVVDDDERRRASRFRADEHRDRFVWRRAVRRWVLAPYVAVPPHRLRFDTRCLRCGHAEHGKPVLVGHDLPFNASQSWPTTALAVGVGRGGESPAPVGVDVQATPADDEILWNALTPDERRVVNRADPGATLLDAWARKEALLKAQGLGLAHDPSSLSVLGADVLTDTDGRLWQLHSMAVPGCSLAVAAVPGARIRIRTFRRFRGLGRFLLEERNPAEVRRSASALRMGKDGNERTPAD